MGRFLALATIVAIGCGSSASGLEPDGGTGGSGGDPDAGDIGSDGGGLSGARTVTLTLNNRPTNANQFSFLVAYQDGSAPWQLAPAPTGDTYSFTIHAPSYGVAFTCITNTGGANDTAPQRSVTSAHFAVGERTAVTLDVPPRCTDRTAANLVSLSGNVSNRPILGTLVVQFGERTAFVGGQSGNFSMQVPPGTRDLIVTRVRPEGSGEFYVDQAVVQRDLAVTASKSVAIDFSGAQSTVEYNVDVSDAPLGSRVVASTTLYTANGTTATLVREALGWESDALAAPQRRASDVYEQSIAVSQLGRGVTVSRATSTPSAHTYVAPAPLGQVSTAVVAKQPYVKLESTWPAYPNAIGYEWNATQQRLCNNSPCTVVWSAYLSPGVTGANPGYRMPELSHLAGWKAGLELGSGQIVGSVAALTSTAGPSDFPAGVPADGTDRVTVRSDYGVYP